MLLASILSLNELEQTHPVVVVWGQFEEVWQQVWLICFPL
jgi:hypothetical protein